MPRPTIEPQHHEYRETWMASAAARLRPVFEENGYPLPETIRFAVAFPSTGSKGNRIGEHWHDASEPNFLIRRVAHALLRRISDFGTNVLCHKERWFVAKAR